MVVSTCRIFVSYSLQTSTTYCTPLPSLWPRPLSSYFEELNMRS